MPHPQNVVILGAGPAGLCAAWNLVQDGHRVIVFEKEPVCGGQSVTFERNGYRYDLGPHNIHSRRDSIIEFLKCRLGNEINEYALESQIYFRGRRITYPLVGSQVLQSLPLLTSGACGFSFLGRRLSSLFIPKFRDDGTYATWVINRFGRRFYNIFFGPYTQKTWKFAPTELSDIVAKKRIAIRNLPELIHAILFKQEQYHPENPRLIRNLYPRQGIGTITELFTKDIRNRGGEIHTGSAVQNIVLRGRQIIKIIYTEKNKRATLDLNSDSGGKNWLVLSTIPINEMILMLEGDIPEQVRNAAGGLDFTAEVFLYLNLNTQDGFRVPLFYFSENEFPFNRVYDVGLFSRAMVPVGKNALCLEITCTHGDDIWNIDQNTLYERCMTPLEKHGLLHRANVEDYHVRRLSHAYPRFRVGYQQKLRILFDYLAKIPNLMTFGRQGLFSYANIDDAIWMGFQVVKELPYRDRISLPIEKMLPDYIDF